MRIQVIIFILLLCCLGINISIAQENNTFSIDMLLNKEWTIAGYEKADYSTKIIYHQEESIITFLYQDKEHSNKNAFYLSATPDKEFDRKKIGSKSGKYLIRETKSGIVAFEILKLTQDSVSLKNLKNKVTVNYIIE